MSTRLTGGEKIRVRPMLPACVCAAVLVVLCFYGFVPPLAAAGIFFLILTGLLVRRGWSHEAVFPLILLLITALSLNTAAQRRIQTARAEGESDTAVLVVTGEPDAGTSAASFTARVEQSRLLPSGIGLMVSAPSGGVAMGDRITASFTVTKAAKRLSASRLAAGIFAEVKCDSAVRVIGRNPLLSAAAAVRRSVRLTLYENLSEREAGLLCALVIGDRSGFDDAFANAVRRAGLSHVMVVSGMHLAILMGGLSGVLRRLRLSRVTQTLLSLTAVLFFSAVCGFTMSILRAGVTYALAALAPLLDRDGDSVNILCGAVTLILALSPYALFSISFQLSVLATFGILVLLPPVSERICARLPSFPPLCGAVSAVIGSVSAMIMTLPVVLWNFGAFSLAAPVSNLLISYAVTADLLITALALAVSVPGFGAVLAKPLFLAAGLIARYILFVIEHLGASDSVMVEMGRERAAAAVILIAFLLGALRLVRRRQELAALEETETGRNKR